MFQLYSSSIGENLLFQKDGIVSTSKEFQLIKVRVVKSLKCNSLTLWYFYLTIN